MKIKVEKETKWIVASQNVITRYYVWVDVDLVCVLNSEEEAMDAVDKIKKSKWGSEVIFEEEI